MTAALGSDISSGSITAVDGIDLFPRLIERRSREIPDQVFVQQVEDDRSVTYHDIHRHGRNWAFAFDRLGIEREQTVITMLPTGIDAIRCWLGLNWIVGWEVPINNSYHGALLSQLVVASTARVAVVAERFLERFVALDDLGRLETVVVPDLTTPRTDLPFRVLGRDEFLGDHDPTDDGRLTGPDPWDVTAVFFTSGTTGPSKGVLYTHAQLDAVTGWLAEDQDPRDRIYCPFPMNHVSGRALVYNIASNGLSGVVRESFKTDQFWTDLQRYECSSTLLMSSMAHFLLRQPQHPDEIDSPLRKVIMIPLIADLDQFKRRFGVQVNTSYNMTETSTPIAANFRDVERMPAGACGRRRDGYECRVVDEHDQEVPRGQLGELIVRADRPWVHNAGYFERPQATVEAWRNGWLHTGDGFIHDEHGWFHFVDRRKDAIRRRGENISSMEVETLVNEHPAVSETAAVAVPSEWGEDEIKVFVVLRPGRAVSAVELHRHLSSTMPRFMVPRYIEFLDALPRTQTDKVRKVELRESALDDATWDSLAQR